MWNSTNEAGQALIKAVNDGIIDEDVPPNLVRKTNKLWRDYNPMPFRCAFHRAFAAKKAEQNAVAKDKQRAGKAPEKMHGTTAKNG